MSSEQIESMSTASLTPHQLRALAILPLISGLTSCCASLWIIVEVVTTREKLYTVYNRLLLAMSIVDVLASVGHLFGPLPMPQEEHEEVAWATGNDSTCTTQGFLVQLSIVAPIYHLCLSIYYLLLVRFGVTQDRIVKYAEPLMHSTALLLGFGTGIACIAMGIFERTTLWCWIVPLPHVYRVSFFYGPLWLSMLLVLGINIWIYDTVRKRENKAEKLHAIHHRKHGKLFEKTNRTSIRVRSIYRTRSVRRLSPSKSGVSFTFGQHPSRIFKQPSQDDESKMDESSTPALDLHPIAEDCTHPRRSVSEPLQISEGKKMEQRKSISEQFEAEQKKGLSVSEKEGDGKPTLDWSVSLASLFKGMFVPAQDDPSFMFTKDNDSEQISQEEEDNKFFKSLSSIQKIVLPERTARRFSKKIQKRQEKSASLRRAEVNFVLATVEDYPSAARQYAATYQIGARLIFYQSIAFVVGFWTIWVFPTAHQILMMKDVRKIYWLVCLQAFFEPLQGFFNFSVYRFAHFVRLKELNPQWSTVKLLRHTLRWTFLTKRNDFAKAKRKSVGMNQGSKSADFIKSVRVNNAGVLDYDSDSDDSSSGLLEAPKTPSVERSKARVLNRMSSLMGDLMTEFADYPDTLNQNYQQVIGEDLFSYPSSFPTVYAQENFSGVPSAFPNVAPMTHFPVGQPLDNSNLPTDQSIENSILAANNLNEVVEVQIHEEEVMISSEIQAAGVNPDSESSGMNEDTTDAKEENEQD